MKHFISTTQAALMATSAVADDWKKDYQIIKFGILYGENEKDRIARYTTFEQYIEKALGV